MSSGELHICLWGEENFKNFTPLLAGESSIQLLVLGDRRQSGSIKNALQGQHGQPQLLHWPEQAAATTTDFLALEQSIADANCAKVYLNLSSGSRLNAMQLLQWALKQDETAVYLIDNVDNLHWLYPNNLPATQVQDLAGLKEYFRVHQLKIIKHGLGIRITDDLRQMVTRWVLEPAIIDPVRQLNWLAASADNSHLSAQLHAHWQQVKSRHLLEDLQDNALVNCSGKTVTFADEPSRFFCNGGWLELFVYDQLCRLKLEIDQLQDVRIGLELEYPQQIKNELDVVFLANNRLHIIEVKTSYLEDKTSVSNQLIYKLEALANALGSEVKAMAVSLSDLPASSIKRAGLYDLQVVAADDLLHLKSRLKHWIEQA